MEQQFIREGLDLATVGSLLILPSLILIIVLWKTRNKMWYLTAGRINRVNYLFGSLIYFALAYALIFFYSEGFWDLTSSCLFLFFLMPFIFSFFLLFFLSVRRLNDLGKSGYWALLMFITPLSLFLWAYLAFAQGQKGKNKFGEDPRKVVPSLKFILNISEKKVANKRKK